MFSSHSFWTYTTEYTAIIFILLLSVLYCTSSLIRTLINRIKAVCCRDEGRIYALPEIRDVPALIGGQLTNARRTTGTRYESKVLDKNSVAISLYYVRHIL